MAYHWLIWDTFNTIGRETPRVSVAAFRYDWFTVSVKVCSLTDADIIFMETNGCPWLWQKMLQAVVDFAFGNPNQEAFLPELCRDAGEFRRDNPQADEILLKFACTAKWLRGHAERIRNTETN